MKLFALNIRRIRATEEMAVVHVEAGTWQEAVAKSQRLDPAKLDWMQAANEPLVTPAQLHTIYQDGKPVAKAKRRQVAVGLSE